jgi:hypothetical protein
METAVQRKGITQEGPTWLCSIVRRKDCSIYVKIPRFKLHDFFGEMKETDPACVNVSRDHSHYSTSFVDSLEVFDLEINHSNEVTRAGAEMTTWFFLHQVSRERVMPE